MQGSPTRLADAFRGILLLILAGMGSAVGASAARAEGWPWPLDLPDRQVTGTFMEARSGRFHSGLDMRTAGRVGVVVRAPVAGRVVRVRASAEGYGRALYLRLDDGRTLVFAHLRAFSDRIRAPLVEAQWRRGRYAQDLYLDGDGLPVEAGEVLALSGATGVGAPHLHFEVRDAKSRPVNPIGLFDLPDDRPPEIRGLRLHPLGADARVEGLARRLVVGEGDSLTVEGRIGVSAALRDLRPGNGFSLMPERVELSVDGEGVYRLRQETFSFAQSGQMELEYEDDPEGGARWLRLYRREGNDLPRREGSEPAGLLRDDGQWHRLRVVAADHDGNTAEADVVLRWQAAERVAPRPTSELRLQTRAEEGHFEILARAVEAPPWVALSSSPSSAIGGWTAADSGSWSTGLDWTELPRGAWSLVGPDGTTVTGPFHDLLGGRAARLEWTIRQGRLVVESPADASFPGGVLRLEAGPASDALPPSGEPQLDTVWAVRRTGWVPRRTIGLRFEPVDPLPEHVGWVLVDGEEVTWLDSKAVDGVLVAEGLDEGTLQLLRDTDAPWIGSPRQQGRPLDGVLDRRPDSDRRVAEGLHLPAWPAIDVPVDDGLSGIEEEDVHGEVDGRPWPVRLDPEAKTASFDFHFDLPPGSHRLELSVRDRSGRRRTAEWSVEFRDSASGP